MVKDANLKKNVLEHGWNILSQKGRDALQIRDLAKLSKCSIGTIYNIFESHNEIILLLNSRCLDKLYTSLFRTLETEIIEKADIHSALQKLGRAYIHFAIEYPQMWKSLFENLTIDPLPTWYREKVRFGIYKIQEEIEKTYSFETEKTKQILSFFWTAMHGMASIMLNKKMEIIHEGVHEEQLNLYINHCLHGFIG